MRKGFTLIEMLVSIAVMAALTTAVVSVMGQGSRQSSRDARRQVDLETISQALGMFRNDETRYPNCLGGAASCDVSTVVGLATRYLPAIPADPASPRLYRYRPTAADGSTDCDNGSPGVRCARFVLCASSEKPTTVDNSGQCGGNCGGFNCVFVTRSQ